MKLSRSYRDVWKMQTIAICATTALLCASCATGARSTSDQKSPKEFSQMYTDLGTQALLRGEFAQAVTDLRTALAKDEQNKVAHNHIALAYYGLGKKALAKLSLEKAIEIDPLYSDAYLNLAKIAEDEQNFQLAKQFYNKALENLEYKARHRPLASLAQLEIRENNTDKARRLLYQAIQLNPDYCLSHFLLGSIFMRERNPHRAAEHFKKSIAHTCVSNTQGHYQLGLAYMKTKKFDQARAQFLRLVEQFPQSIEAQRAGEQLRNMP